DHGARAGVADAEAHAGPADDVEPAARRAVETRVACDRLAMRLGGEAGLGRDDHGSARQALRDVVVGLADEPEIDAGPGECAEGLAGGTAQAEMDGARQLVPLDRAGQAGPERSVGGRQGQALGPEARLAVQDADQPALQWAGLAAPDVVAGRCRVRAALARRRPAARADHGVEIERRGPPIDRQEPARLADQLPDLARADRRHLDPQALGESEGEPLDLLGGAGELRP